MLLWEMLLYSLEKYSKVSLYISVGYSEESLIGARFQKSAKFMSLFVMFWRMILQFLAAIIIFKRISDITQAMRYRILLFISDEFWIQTENVWISLLIYIQICIWTDIVKLIPWRLWKESALCQNNELCMPSFLWMLCLYNVIYVIIHMIFCI